MSEKHAGSAKYLRPKRPLARAKARQVPARVSRTLTLLLPCIMLLLYPAAGAINYYSGLQYTFSTPYNENWEYSWDATPCCDDESKPCCYDPTKIDKNTFVLTAPDVDLPTEVTISVVVRNKKLASCMDMATLKIIVRPLAGIAVLKRPLGGDGTFAFTGTGFSEFSGMKSFSLSPTNRYTIFVPNLNPGTYSITEHIPPGWVLDGIEVNGADPENYQISGDSITIEHLSGESPVITFIDKKLSSITVVKRTVGADAVFNFTGTGFEPGSALESFKLMNGQSRSESNLTPEIPYTIAEAQLDGWEQSIEVTGTNAASTAGNSITITPEPGESPVITFTNTRLLGNNITGYMWNDANGNCRLDQGEQMLPGWAITLKNASGKIVASTTTDEDGNYIFRYVSAGKYTIEETLQSGWTPACPAEGKAEIDLAGGDVVQNFGNRKANSIIVIKDAIPDGSQAFAFTGTLGDFSLMDDGTPSDRAIFENLQAQDYEILEDVPSGWSLESVECKGASSDVVPNGLVVHLKDGESATVRFVDTKMLKGLRLAKTTLNTSAKRGQEIIYTIEVSNDGPLPLTNVTLWDVLPDSVEQVRVNPEPDSSLYWHIGRLAPGQRFVVDLAVRVKKIDIYYDMTQRVQGEGFVNVYSNYDTSPRDESVRNCAYARADFTETISNCAFTHIEDPGTELMKRESGSGVYASEEISKMRTENKSIKIATSLSAVHKPTTFSLPNGRFIDYGTKWTEKFRGRNEATGTTMTEEYTSASKIERNGSTELDRNGSTMKSEVEFEGIGHIGILKKAEPDAAARSKPAYEAQEEYAGSFKVYEYVDEYGTSVISNRSTTGSGYAAVDARIKGSQRSYESGTGSYHSEEMVETSSSYMAKNISLIHEPTSYAYSPSFLANQSLKWSEGMWSKSGGLAGGVDIAGCMNCRQPVASSCLGDGITPGTLISERYSYLDSLQKETTASGLNEMMTDALFNGQADYRVVRHGDNNTDGIDEEEHYSGSYGIKRHVLLTGTSRYDTPHLTLIKEGETKTEWYNGTDAALAEYKISIINDGNRALAPIRVRDIFPPGTEYVRSTMRPVVLNPSGAEWTVQHLGIGDKMTIGLTLNITEFAQGDVVNRVQACGNYENGTACAENYSVIEFSWLTCCPPKALLSKKAWLDDVDSTVVHYRIAILNEASEIVAARVTDQLPGGMTLLDASIDPNIDSSGQMIWALPEIMPGLSKTIDYTTKASRDGGYTNIVHMDAAAINGESLNKAEAAAYIEVTGTGNVPRTYRYGDWEPPDWDLSTSESILTMEPELDLWEESVMENLTAGALG